MIDGRQVRADARNRLTQLLRRAVACAAMALATVLQTVQAEPGALRVLDDFHDVGAWQVSTSDDVKARLRSVAGSTGRALCMDFDFGTVSGYAVARRELPLEYADNFEFSFGLQGQGPAELTPVQAGRRERRERLVGQSTRSPVSARVAAGPLQEAEDRVCLGAGDGP